MSLFRKKSLEDLLIQAQGSNLKRTLGAGSLIALGIGAIIGAGLFVRTAAAATEAAGSGVTLSFVVAAIGCAFAGLCYAEFAAMIPISGSAYAYSFVTMGELVAWIIGWSLIMEYALGAATVSIAWSEYLNNLFDGAIPYEWCHSPFEKLYKVSADVVNQLQALPGDWKGIEKGILSADQFAYLSEHYTNMVSSVSVTSGVLNAPKFGDKAKWAPLIAEGQVTLTAHGYVGVRGMPAKGGNPNLTVEGFSDAVVYMVNKAGGNWKSPDAKTLAAINKEIEARKASLNKKP
jgi:APA family basic amino acid/polyamine antiporter